jgi:hypothetical protein
MHNYAYEATKGIHEADALANMFFSRANIDKLQQLIRFGVYRNSGGKHVIDTQSEDELKVIMRSFYLDHGTFKSFMIEDETKHLNKLVYEFCIPRILNEIKTYMQYLEDSQKSSAPMQHAQSTSIKGNNSIEMKPFL